jgi:hypothetical protein
MDTTGVSPLALPVAGLGRALEATDSESETSVVRSLRWPSLSLSQDPGDSGCEQSLNPLCFALLSSHFQVKPTHSLHTTTDKLNPPQSRWHHWQYPQLSVRSAVGADAGSTSRRCKKAITSPTTIRTDSGRSALGNQDGGPSVGTGRGWSGFDCCRPWYTAAGSALDVAGALRLEPTTALIRRTPLVSPDMFDTR